MLIIDNLPNPDLNIVVVGHVTPYKIKKGCFLSRSCLGIAFMVEQVFLLRGKFGQCIVQIKRV